MLEYTNAAESLKCPLLDSVASNRWSLQHLCLRIENWEIMDHQWLWSLKKLNDIVKMITGYIPERSIWIDNFVEKWHEVPWSDLAKIIWKFHGQTKEKYTCQWLTTSRRFMTEWLHANSISVLVTLPLMTHKSESSAPGF